MKTIITVISLSTILICLAASAQTQQRATGDGIAKRFNQLDRNGDGKLSADEFPGPQFKQMDKNGDGFVTLEEARAFYAERGTACPASERPENPPARPVAAAAGDASATSGVRWTDVYPIGTQDAGGQTMYGIQMTFLVPHKGKLFAGNGTQGETETDKYPKAAQVLVLDSPAGRWKVDKQFTTDSPRVNSLASFTFLTDSAGKPVPPDTLLITAPGSRSKRFVAYVRNDATGEWVATKEMRMERAPTFAQPRAMALYRDAITGVQHIFVGIEGDGVFRGVYDPKLPCRIAWNPVSEFIPENSWQRVINFAEANGKLYLAFSSSGDSGFSKEKDLLAHIYERTDGPKPAWRRVYTTEPGLAWEDMRGLTAVPDPHRPGKQRLVFAWNDKVYGLDPLDNYRVQVEFDMKKGIAEQTGLPVMKVVAGYDDFMPFEMPPTGEKVWLTGLSVFVNPVQSTAPNLKGWLRDGLYLVRRQVNDRIEYQVRYIFKNDPANVTRTLLAVRDFAVSPFREDEGKVLYACGLDHQGQPMSLAAWIYRGDLRATNPKAVKP